ncbi:hypothetical protein RZ964_002540 [Acinetobacter baumannii]|uniref:hypothetical protein n=1 Tax=Acinetobacter baumannii TaxID=470 RepID=UPI00093505B8|nr:hypothetical protein [Acinetobacter baumannii]ELN8903595.1 hypothetical protein [Acinetobacter baumannii]ELT0787983.1 hypothetical protein [Acinetobacter baumannii]MDV7434232.1 hypothetical protein [Acinetobacter baumannii]HCE0436524.1 hypothetical protein [Acinetobacter baumannii]
MVNKYLMIEMAKIATRNISLVAIDNISFGMGSGVKNAADEMTRYASLCNEALYHMQVRTFLETVDLNQDEVNNFFNANPDNQRLGVEIFKILENTILEKQSKYIAIAFKRYVRGEIDSRKFHQYLYVIDQMNRHIVDEIEQDLEIVDKHTMHGLPSIENEMSIVAFTNTNASKNQVLQNIGFLVERTEKQELLMTGDFEPKLFYFRTRLYLDFYLEIIKEE